MRNVPGEHSLDNETVIAHEIGYRQQFGTSPVSYTHLALPV